MDSEQPTIDETVPYISDKSDQRTKIEQDITEYLKKGGRITECSTTEQCGIKPVFNGKLVEDNKGASRKKRKPRRKI